MILCCNWRAFSLTRASALALLLAAGHSAANPTGPTVTRGQATFSTQGNTLTVTNSPSAIINWQSFSIPSPNITQFIQQSAASAVLNRVVASNPSAILGTLSSNGQVFLINPNGVVFGPNAQVNTASLTATTSQISDGSFLAGVIPPPAPGSSIVTITASSGTINLSGAQQISLAGNALSPPPSPGIVPNGNTAVNPGVTGTAIDTPPSIGSSGNTIVTTTGGTNATPIAVAVNITSAGPTSVAGDTSAVSGATLSANFTAMSVNVSVQATVGPNVWTVPGASTGGVLTGTFTPITVNPTGTASPYYSVSTNNQPSAAGVTYNLITGVAAFAASPGIGSAGNTIATTTGGITSTGNISTSGNTSISGSVGKAKLLNTGTGLQSGNVVLTGAGSGGTLTVTSGSITGNTVTSGTGITVTGGIATLTGSSGNSGANVSISGSPASTMTTGTPAVSVNLAAAAPATNTVGISGASSANSTSANTSATPASPGSQGPAGQSSSPTPIARVILQKREPLY